MKTAPIVNLNTAELIKQLIGDYNDENKDIIDIIAKNESFIMEGCETLSEYAANMVVFIANQKGRIK